MATYNAIGPWGGIAEQYAQTPTQTYEEFLVELAKRPGLLGADGTLQGSAIGGGPWDSWGKTPKQFYDEKMAEKVQSGFTGAGDNLTENWVPQKSVSLDRTEDTRGQGLRVGLGMLAAPFAAQAFGLGGAASAGPASSAGGTGAFSFGTPAQIATGIDLGAVPTVAGGGGSLGALGGSGAALGGAGGLGGSATKAALYGASGYGPAASAAEMAVGGGSAGGLLGDATSWLKANPTLTQLGGAALGALSAKDQTQTSTQTKDPWGPAQQYLKDNLATNAAMQKHYQANPFSGEQQNAYQGLLNTLANNQANGNVLLGNASRFGQSAKGVMPQMQGLLTGTQAPIIDWAKYANIGLLGG